MEPPTTPLATAADFLRRNGLAPLSRDNWMLLLRFWKFFVLVLIPSLRVPPRSSAFFPLPPPPFPVSHFPPLAPARLP